MGYDTKKFSSHSGRIGGATTLFAEGLPAEYIRQIGRWESNVWMFYARRLEPKYRDAAELINGSNLRVSDFVLPSYDGSDWENLVEDNV